MLRITSFRMDISIIQYQFGLSYPTQMNLTFTMDSSATIIDIHDAHMILRTVNNQIISNFGNRIFTQFHLVNTAQITTDPLANAY